MFVGGLFCYLDLSDVHRWVSIPVCGALIVLHFVWMGRGGRGVRNFTYLPSSSRIVDLLITQSLFVCEKLGSITMLYPFIPLPHLKSTAIQYGHDIGLRTVVSSFALLVNCLHYEFVGIPI